MLNPPRPEWAGSCLTLRITAWRRGNITRGSLADAVRLAVKQRVQLDTINRLLAEVGLAWDMGRSDLMSLPLVSPDDDGTLLPNVT